MIMNFLHTYIPDPVAFTIGNLTIHWYGLIMALSVIVALLLSLHIAKRREIPKEDIIDASFWLIIGGLIGARLYEVGLEWDYYSTHLEMIPQLWKGGLAIHGAIIGGLIALGIFVRRKQYNIWNITAVILPGFALAQSIGRWGNWFNQELFGTPTLRPWGIPIDLLHRPFKYEVFTYFHPVFLYESLGLLVIAALLYFMARKKDFPCAIIVAAYLIMAGALRFRLEYIKSDITPIILGLRWPQIASLLMILAGVVICLKVSAAIKKAKS